MSGWNAITEHTPAPAGVPLQVRCEFHDSHGRVAVTLPLFFNRTRWRHVNRSPEEAGAWLEPKWTPTHWQVFADPALPDVRYAVIERTYLSSGRVLARATDSDLSFAAALDLMHSRRRSDRFFMADCPREPFVHYEYYIERMSPEQVRDVDAVNWQPHIVFGPPWRFDYGPRGWRYAPGAVMMREGRGCS